MRPICGVGWCAREAWTCDPANCDPGEPQPETCNLLDDDCDDELDEDAECPSDGPLELMCIAGECRSSEGSEGEGGTTSETGAVGDGGGTSSETGTTAQAAGGGSRCAIDDRSTAWWWLVVLGLRRRRSSR